MAIALTPIGMLLFGLLYDLFPAQWVLLTSSILSIITILFLARPSIVRKAHPELEKPIIKKPNHMYNSLFH